MLAKRFVKCKYLLKSPYLVDKATIIDFLLDVKEAGFPYVQVSKADLMKMDENELAIEFDVVRSYFHQNAELLFARYPSLKRSYFKSLIYDTGGVENE